MPVSEGRTVPKLSLQGSMWGRPLVSCGCVSVCVIECAAVEVPAGINCGAPSSASPAVGRASPQPPREAWTLNAAGGGQSWRGQRVSPLSPPPPDRLSSLSWNSSSFLFTPGGSGAATPAPKAWGDQSVGPACPRMGVPRCGGTRSQACALRRARAGRGPHAFALRKPQLRRSERTGAPGGLRVPGFREAQHPSLRPSQGRPNP